MLVEIYNNGPIVIELSVEGIPEFPMTWSSSVYIELVLHQWCCKCGTTGLHHNEFANTLKKDCGYHFRRSLVPA